MNFGRKVVIVFVFLKLLKINLGITAILTAVGWMLFLFCSDTGGSLPNLVSKMGFILIAPMYFLMSDSIPHFFDPQQHPFLCLAIGLICQFLVYTPLTVLLIGVWRVLRKKWEHLRVTGA